MSPAFQILTLGCKSNLADSQQLKGRLEQAGWVEHGSDCEQAPDLCVVNTCTVTDEADGQSQKALKDFQRRYPKSRIVAMGCGAQAQPTLFSQLSGSIQVLSQAQRAEDLSWVHGPLEGAHVSPSPRWPALEEAFEPSYFRSEARQHTRVFLKVQEGCEAFCTYCIIPYGRGPRRSLPPERVIQAIREWVSEGVQEVVLTGTNLGDYATEDPSKGNSLESLVRRILLETELPRLRLSSLDPREVTEGLFQLLESEPRLCRHLHLALQSPLSSVLRRMKRRYRGEDVELFFQRLRALQAKHWVYVGMDLITGFPGETEEEFQQAFEQLSSESSWSRLHVFPYSERQGTPATRLPNPVPRATRSRWAKRWRALSLKRLEASYRGFLKALAEKGQDCVSVLLEKPDPRGWQSGLTREGWRCLLPPRASGIFDRRGQEVQVRLIDVMRDAQKQEMAFVSLKVENA